jgi:hypothetical protein
MTPDEEQWAEALAIQRQYGEHMYLHVVERIGALALAGDMVEVARWQAIAARLDQLTRGTVQ